MFFTFSTQEKSFLFTERFVLVYPSMDELICELFAGSMSTANMKTNDVSKINRRTISRRIESMSIVMR